MNTATEKQLNKIETIFEKMNDGKDDIDIIKFFEVVAFSDNFTSEQASKIISMTTGSSYADTFIDRLQDKLHYFNEDTQNFLKLYFDDSFETPESMVLAYEIQKSQSMNQTELEAILDETHGKQRNKVEKIAQDVWTIRFSVRSKSVKIAKARIETPYYI